MTIEFGNPKDLYQACIRIPDRTHPNYEIQGSPHEHCAHFRDLLEDLSTIGCSDKLPLEARMAPLVTEDLRLLFKLNSFKRNLSEGITTIHWAHLEAGEDIWSQVLPVGDNDYRWWQITTMTPDTTIGNCKLYCIEMNSKYKPEDTATRFNQYSEFELVFATEEEINLLKEKLGA